jgi:hypothetical protein
MRKRPITALVAALALLAALPAAAQAQDPTPTPTATAQQSQGDGSAAQAPSNASKEVKAIYTDYSRDGVIGVCNHTRANLQKTLDTIEADFDRDFPDFREAVKAGIQRHDSNKCASDAGATATATATASPGPNATATASPESGALPSPDPGSSTDGGASPPPDTGSLPPQDGALPPAADGSGAVPPAATATVAPPVAAATPAPVPTPVIVTRSGTDGLLIPGILIAIALLGAGLLAAMAIGGRGSPKMRHAYSEAAFRTRGMWADFSDWLKIGR